MSPSIYRRLASLESEDESVALATIVRSQGSVPRHRGSKMLVHPDGRIEGTIGGGQVESEVISEALEALKDNRPRLLHYEFRDPEKGDVGVCGGEMEVYVEPIKPDPKLIIVGGGHVGQALAHLAKWLGMRVVLVDDRHEFATPEMVPEADQFVKGSLEELPEKVKVNDTTYVVLTTRSVEVDMQVLPSLLETSAAYIGVIGSRRRWETCAQQLLEAGISRELINRVVSPIGLDIGAETPEEIAVSVLAEIILLREGGSGDRLAHHITESIIDRGEKA